MKESCTLADRSTAGRWVRFTVVLPQPIEKGASEVGV